MTTSRKTTEAIRQFILQNIEAYPQNISSIVAETFSISRQAANRHVASLVSKGFLQASGSTRNRRYILRFLINQTFTWAITTELEEHIIWRTSIYPLLKDIAPPNVLAICNHGLTEMINNVIDHAQGKRMAIEIAATKSRIALSVFDDGVGIFSKIKTDFHLEDIRQAIFELVKGKLTSDPEHHTGEGIFFTSRMFDKFSLTSDGVMYVRMSDEAWLVEDKPFSTGTVVNMMLQTQSTRNITDVFAQYEGDDYDFARTHVPVKLAMYEGEQLVSRSQAKRLLARFHQFKEVFLDFDGVTSIGQAFADEIFRVFRSQHPEITLVWIHANSDVQRMILRAEHKWREQTQAQHEQDTEQVVAADQA